MPTLDAGEVANIVLNAGDVCRAGTNGQCTVSVLYGGPTGVTTITSETQDFGPYQAPAKLRITGLTGNTTCRVLESDNQAIYEDGRRPISYFGLGLSIGGRIDIDRALERFKEYIDNIAAYSDSNLPFRSSNKPAVFLPSGTYVTGTRTVFNSRDVCILGEGASRSVIYNNSSVDSPLFDFGAFSATPSTSVFLGTAQSALVSGIGFCQGVGFPSLPASIGAKTGQAIRCSGGGGLALNDVRASGFKYGVNVPYGGDFCDFNRVRTEFCDVGVYFGPGAQQVLVNSLDVAFCNEGLVLDRVAHATFINLNAGSCKKSNIVFEAGRAAGVWPATTTGSDTTTRQLSSFPAGGTSIQSSILFVNSYLESNASATASADYQVPNQIIEVNCTATDAIRGVTFQGARLFCGVSTSPAKTCAALIANTGTNSFSQHIELRKFVFAGTLTAMGSGTLGGFVGIQGWRTENGYSLPAYGTIPHFSDAWTGDIGYASSIPNWPSRRGTFVFNQAVATGGTQPIGWVNTNGSTTWAALANLA